MTGWSPRQTAALAVVAVAIASALAVGFVRHGRVAEAGFALERAALAAEPATPAKGGAASPPTGAPAAPPQSSEVVVHVAGRVEKPGVYHLPAGSRGIDAVKAAGGAKPDANQDAVNLAAPLEDGQQLYLPSRTEQPTGGASAAPAASARPSGASRTAPRGSATARGRASSAGSSKLTQPGSGTVNINSAASTELQRLPGVGPAMAERILAYRKEIGRFARVEQLMDVSGIGEKKLARMRPFVTVGGR